MKTEGLESLLFSPPQVKPDYRIVTLQDLELNPELVFGGSAEAKKLVTDRFRRNSDERLPKIIKDLFYPKQDMPEPPFPEALKAIGIPFHLAGYMQMMPQHFQSDSVPEINKIFEALEPGDFNDEKFRSGLLSRRLTAIADTKLIAPSLNSRGNMEVLAGAKFFSSQWSEIRRRNLHDKLWNYWNNARKPAKKSGLTLALGALEAAGKAQPHGQHLVKIRDAQARSYRLLDDSALVVDAIKEA